MNTGFFSKELRFAAVDCATEKALCIEQGQTSRSWVFAVHYHHGKQRESTWRATNIETAEKEFIAWLQRALGFAQGEADASKEQPAVEEARLIEESVIDEYMDDIIVEAAIVVIFVAVGALAGTSFWRRGSPPTGAKALAKTVEEWPSGGADASIPLLVRCLPKSWAQERPSLLL